MIKGVTNDNSPGVRQPRPPYRLFYIIQRRAIKLTHRFSGWRIIVEHEGLAYLCASGSLVESGDDTESLRTRIHSVEAAHESGRGGWLMPGRRREARWLGGQMQMRSRRNCNLHVYKPPLHVLAPFFSILHPHRVSRPTRALVTQVLRLVTPGPLRLL